MKLKAPKPEVVRKIANQLWKTTDQTVFVAYANRVNKLWQSSDLGKRSKPETQTTLSASSTEVMTQDNDHRESLRRSRRKNTRVQPAVSAID